MKNKKQGYYTTLTKKFGSRSFLLLLIGLLVVSIFPNQNLDVLRAEREYTVYVDASNLDESWEKNGAFEIWVGPSYDTDHSSYLMEKSDRGENIYEYTFTEKYSRIDIYSFIGNSGKTFYDSGSRSAPIDIPWDEMESPCFEVFVQGKESNPVGKWKDLDYTGRSYTIYFDASNLDDSWRADGTADSEYEIGFHAFTEGYNIRPYFYYPILMDKSDRGENIYEYTFIGKAYPNIIFTKGEGTRTEGWENITLQTVNLEVFWSLMESPCFTITSGEQKWHNGIWKDLDQDTLNLDESKYVNGDASISIPKTDKPIELAEDTYYATSTLYDYYSDFELTTGTSKNECEAMGFDVIDYKDQFRFFNQKIAQYFRNNGSEANPLYFGDFWVQKNNFDWSNDDFNKNWNFSNFDYYKNNSANNENSAYQGLVDDKLTNGKVTMGGLEIPYFNEAFLRDATTPLGSVYEDVTFPFVLNYDGYWEFDSEKRTHALQLKESESDGYFLERTKQAIQGATIVDYPYSYNGNYLNRYVDYTTGFFPFNDSEQSQKANKLDYGFGMEMEIPFTLTKDGTIDVNGENKDIVFDFSGDDDVWIYIDGKLVLDIGGDHGRVEGSINFATQKATVSSVKDAEGNNPKAVTTSFADLLPIDTYTSSHTMKVFYMERGLWESNMKIQFNFPEYNNFQVEKEVNTSKANTIFSEALMNLKNEEFDFEIENLVTDGIDYTSTDKPTDMRNDIIKNVTSDSESIIFNSYVDVPKDSISNPHGYLGWGPFIKDGKTYAKAARYSNSYSDDKGIEESNCLQILPANNNETFESLDVLSVSDYLSFDIFVEGRAYHYTDPSNIYYPIPNFSIYIDLIDSDGTRIGGLVDDFGYQNYNNIMQPQQINSFKVDLNKMKENVFDEGSEKGFDFTSVKKIQVSSFKACPYDMFISPLIFNKETAIIDTSKINGFVVNPSTVNDYGSVTSQKLEKANGAVYEHTTDAGNTTQTATNGLFSLAHNQIATFRNQFRKGSYIALSEREVNTDIFDTKWTLYENGKEISEEDINKTTSKITQTQDKTTLSDVKSVTLADGREVVDAVDGITQPENAIAFYHYNEPDSIKSSLMLKAKYTNILKTGSITIKKELVDADDVNLDTAYTFKVTFNNVAGMGLEDEAIETEVKVKAGEEVTLDGIPVGTSYVVEEIKAGNDFILKDIKHDSDVEVDVENYTVSGVMVEANETFEFVNLAMPTVRVAGTKSWDDNDSADRPTNITIQVERKVEGSKDATHEIAKDTEGNKLEQIVVSADDAWAYSVANLPKYEDYTAKDKKAYVYRVVEVKTDDTAIEKTDYTPEYTTDKDGNLNITNKEVGSITIKKVDENNKPLAGAIFVLEKKRGENDWVEIATLDMKDRTENTFYNLQRADYRIREITAPNGYQVLTEPIIVSLPADYKKGDVLNDAVVDSDGKVMNLALTIANEKIVEVPKEEEEIKEPPLKDTDTPNDDTPDTGDTSNLLFSLSQFLVFAGIIIVLTSKRKRQYSGV